MWNNYQNTTQKKTYISRQKQHNLCLKQQQKQHGQIALIGMLASKAVWKQHANISCVTNHIKHASKKGEQWRYPEPPKNGSAKNGEKPTSEALVNSRSVAEKGRWWPWRDRDEQLALRPIHGLQRYEPSLNRNIVVFSKYSFQTGSTWHTMSLNLE